MKSICGMFFAVSLISMGPMFGNAQAAAAADVEWNRTVEAAKQEGKVGVFLYQRENIEAAVKVFEKKFPDIEVTVASSTAAATGPRLMAERRAG